MCMCIYVYIYIYMHTHICTYTHMYIPGARGGKPRGAAHYEGARATQTPAKESREAKSCDPSLVWAARPQERRLRTRAAPKTRSAKLQTEGLRFPEELPLPTRACPLASRNSPGAGSPLSPDRALDPGAPHILSLSLYIYIYVYVYIYIYTHISPNTNNTNNHNDDKSCGAARSSPWEARAGRRAPARWRARPTGLGPSGFRELQAAETFSRELQAAESFRLPRASGF